MLRFLGMLVFKTFRLRSIALCILLLSQKALNQSRTVVRILCFGDSLTFGLTNSVPHPYSEKLQEYLRFNEGKHRHVELYNAGRAGEKVQQEMPLRLTNILQGSTGKYNWVIILGGTNDLMSMQSIWEPSQSQKDELAIFNAIVQLHKVSHRAGAKTVAMTIPALQCEKSGATSGRFGLSTIMEVRLKVNERIRKLAANSAGKVVLADLDKQMLLPRNQLLCSDGIHLTPSAYDRMAAIIYYAIKDWV